MPTEQEVLDYLNEHGMPKDYRDNLRDQFVDLQKQAKDWQSKAELYEKSQRTPLIEQALSEHAKVDVKSLTKAHRAIIEQELAEGDLTPERVTQLANEWELPTAQEGTAQTQQPPAAAVTNQATGASGTHDENAAFYAALDAVPDGDTQGTRKVLEQFGRLANSQ